MTARRPRARNQSVGTGDVTSLLAQPLTAETVTAARRTVAHHAADAEEAAVLLAMLGLDEPALADRCPVCREHVHHPDTPPRHRSSLPIAQDGKCKPCHTATRRT